MNYLKTLFFTFTLITPLFTGSVYAEETQSSEKVTEEQAGASDKSSAQKKKAEAEPECD